MSSAPASPGKVCVVCQSDVANMERVKDPQGHYYCKPCYAGARQKAAADRGATPTPPTPAARRPAPAAPKPAKPAPRPAVKLDGKPVPKLVDDLPSLDELNDFEFSASSGPTCPSCGGPMASDAILCTGCGYNRTTGGHISTGVGVPPPVKIVKSGRGSAVGMAAGAGMANLIRQPWVFGVCMIGFFLVFFLVAKGNNSLIPPYLVVQSLFGLGIGIWLLVVAFKDAVIQGLLCFFTCGFYALYYCYARQDNAHLKWGYTASLISYLLGYSMVGAAAFSAFPNSSNGLNSMGNSSIQSPVDSGSDEDEASNDADGSEGAEMTDTNSGDQNEPSAGSASEKETTKPDKSKPKAGSVPPASRGPRGAGRKTP